MKRRNNAELSSKTRRPVKKIPKLYDGFYTSLVVYVKLLLLWICVMGGDFILEFRLEYLYPVYLVLQNSYEAYEAKGIAFALLMVCIVVSVDVICLGVIPAQWLFLLGSLTVWVEIGWSFVAPLGPLLLLPSLIYIDGKAIRPIPSQSFCFLAAHCLGVPLVSLFIGLKSLIGSRLKQRIKNDVGRQNEFLYSLLWEALPFNTTILSPVNNNEVIKNGDAVLLKKQQNGGPPPPPLVVPRRKSFEGGAEFSEKGEKSLSPIPFANHHSNLVNNANATHNTSPLSSTLPSQISSPNTSNSSSNSVASSPPCITCTCMLVPPKRKKDDCCLKLESEIRKLRSDLHSEKFNTSQLRTNESELRGHIKNLRSDISTLQGEHEALQLKYSDIIMKGQEERQNYEKRLTEERRLKENAISKQKKAFSECSGDCKRKLRDADREKESLRRDIKNIEDKNIRVERELKNVKSTLLHEQKNKEPTGESQRLITALQNELESFRIKVDHLDQSLSAETRLKLDLFSALGEARRQLSIRESIIKAKDDELEEVRSQLVELLAVSDFSGQRQNQIHNLLRAKNLNLGMSSSPSSPQQGNENLNSFSSLIES